MSSKDLRLLKKLRTKQIEEKGQPKIRRAKTTFIEKINLIDTSKLSI